MKEPYVITTLGLSILAGCGELPADGSLGDGRADEVVAEAEGRLLASDRIVHNGLASRNGGPGNNGVFTRNGGPGNNGMLTQNGGGATNGLAWNGVGTTNGGPGNNGIGTSAGASLVNGAPTLPGLGSISGLTNANGLLYLGRVTNTGEFRTDDSPVGTSTVYQVQDRERDRQEPEGGCVAAGCSAGYTCQKNPASFYYDQCEADTPTSCTSDSDCSSGYVCNLQTTVRIWNTSQEAWTDQANPDENTCERRTATYLQGIDGYYSSVSQTFDWAAANGDSLACRSMSASSASCKNGLSVAYGLKTEDGLKSDGFLMQSEDGRKLISYLVRCALGPEEAITKTYDGTTYEFKGQLGLATSYGPAHATCGLGKYGTDIATDYDASCASWRNTGITTSQQELVSACLLAHTNTAGNHVDIWVESEAPWLQYDALRNVDSSNTYAWKGRPRAFSAQEGAFFGNVLTTASSGKIEGYYCDGFGINRGTVAGRLGSQGPNRPYVNPFSDYLCEPHCTENASENPEGYKDCTVGNRVWHKVITVWRKASDAAFDFESTYKFKDGDRFAIRPTSAVWQESDNTPILVENATVTGKVEVHPGNNTISVNAKGEASLGTGAHMVVMIDGTTIIDTYVNATSFTTFSGTYNNAGSAGQKTVTVTFDNGEEGRNLALDTITVDDGGNNLEGWSVVQGTATVQRANGNDKSQGCYTFQRYIGDGALRVLGSTTTQEFIKVQSSRKTFVGPGRLSFKVWVPGGGGVSGIKGYYRIGSTDYETPPINPNTGTNGRWVETSVTLASGQTTSTVGVTFAEQGNFNPTIREVEKPCTQNSDCLTNSCVSGYCSTSVACTGTDIPTGSNIPSVVIDAIQYDTW